MEIQLIRINQGSIPTFNESTKRYEMWLTKFKIFDNLNGFTEAIHDEPDPNMPTNRDSKIDTSTEEDKMQIVAKRTNNLAISSFTIVFTKKEIMILVSKSKTKE